MQRNEYVLKNMFGSFFLATVMTALMAQLGGIADSIVMGHLVSPDALSVVRIWLPVENFMFIIIGLMSAGAFFLGTFFDGTGHDAQGHSMHFMVMYNFDCKDIAELKAFILENSDEFAVSVREQIVLLHDLEEQMHESDDAV